MNKILSIIFLLVLFSGCGQGGSDKTRGNDYLVTIKTSYGEMIAILYDETPKHKENFIKLAKEKYFDSTLFHRVIQDFMIQGGDPDSKNAVAGQRLGMGGPDYTIPAEFVPKYFHEKGALSAARLADQQNPNKESSGSQFYIVQGRVLSEEEANSLKYDQAKLMAGLGQMYQSNQYPLLFDTLNKIYTTGDMNAYQAKLYSLAPRIEKITGVKIFRDVNPEMAAIYTSVGGVPHLDGEYTVFGKVIKGLEVIDKIAAQPNDEGNRPFEDIRMTITVEEMAKSKISELYGYQFK